MLGLGILKFAFTGLINEDIPAKPISKEPICNLRSSIRQTVKLPEMPNDMLHFLNYMAKLYNKLSGNLKSART